MNRQLEAKLKYLCRSCTQVIHPFAVIVPDFDVCYDDVDCGWCHKSKRTYRTDWISDPESYVKQQAAS